MEPRDFARGMALPDETQVANALLQLSRTASRAECADREALITNIATLQRGHPAFALGMQGSRVPLSPGPLANGRGFARGMNSTPSRPPSTPWLQLSRAASRAECLARGALTAFDLPLQRSRAALRAQCLPGCGSICGSFGFNGTARLRAECLPEFVVEPMDGRLQRSRAASRAECESPPRRPR